ncbi:MAG: glycerol kinase, partial [Desulfobacteraceae bacterium]|nr:glycerol kinase [Desulfobacteraceae bacterium]
AGLAVGFWPDTEALKENWHVHSTWEPNMDDTRRKNLYASWKKAVQKSLAWKE